MLTGKIECWKHGDTLRVVDSRIYCPLCGLARAAAERRAGINLVENLMGGKK